MGTDREARLEAALRDCCDAMEAMIGRREPGFAIEEIIDAGRAALSTPPEATPEPPVRRVTLADIGITRAQVSHLHEYVVDHASDHDEDCPEDDTCDCSMKARNDAVSHICRALWNHLPPVVLEPPTPEPERPAERCVWREVAYRHVAPSCPEGSTDGATAFHVTEAQHFRVCPYCAAPLSVEEDTE